MCEHSIDASINDEVNFLARQLQARLHIRQSCRTLRMEMIERELDNVEIDCAATPIGGNAKARYLARRQTTAPLACLIFPFAQVKRNASNPLRTAEFIAVSVEFIAVSVMASSISAPEGPWIVLAQSPFE